MSMPVSDSLLALLKLLSAWRPLVGIGWIAACLPVYLIEHVAS